MLDSPAQPLPIFFVQPQCCPLVMCLFGRDELVRWAALSAVGVSCYQLMRVELISSNSAFLTFLKAPFRSISSHIINEAYGVVHAPTVLTSLKQQVLNVILLPRLLTTSPNQLNVFEWCVNLLQTSHFQMYEALDHKTAPNKKYLIWEVAAITSQMLTGLAVNVTWCRSYSAVLFWRGPWHEL